jgi:hypothetical protein
MRVAPLGVIEYGLIAPEVESETGEDDADDDDDDDDRVALVPNTTVGSCFWRLSMDILKAADKSRSISYDEETTSSPLYKSMRREQK